MPKEQSNTLLPIDAVWMAVSVDDDGTEGVCAVLVGDAWMPLLAADEKRLPFVMEAAQQIATREQRTIRIIRLTDRTVIHTIEGAKQQCHT